MTDEEIRRLARAVADEAWQAHWAALGVDIDDPDSVARFHQNTQFLNRWRTLSERVGATVLLTVATALTGGLLKLVWDAVRMKSGN